MANILRCESGMAWLNTGTLVPSPADVGEAFCKTCQGVAILQAGLSQSMKRVTPIKAAHMSGIIASQKRQAVAGSANTPVPLPDNTAVSQKLMKARPEVHQEV